MHFLGKNVLLGLVLVAVHSDASFFSECGFNAAHKEPNYRPHSALLKDPPILLLDEATASVDNQTELLIQQALDELMKNRTSIVIAHRLSTIQNADRIYVLQKGRVIEEGPYDELIKQGGKFAELANTIK